MKRKESATVLVLILVLLLSATLIACNGAVDITLSFIVDGEVYHTIDTKGNEEIKLPADNGS